MRVIAITISAGSILFMGGSMFVTGRFDLATAALIGTLFALMAWALWDDMD